MCFREVGYGLSSYEPGASVTLSISYPISYYFGTGQLTIR